MDVLCTFSPTSQFKTSPRNMESHLLRYSDSSAIRVAEEYRQRKLTSILTIAFTDICNSTALREQLGEIKYEQVREEHDDHVQDLIETDDSGCIVKSTGDGVLAVFSEPSVAVEKCVELQNQMAGHEFFKLRIGLDMGQVTVKSKGGIVQDVFGRHVNRAARIEALAEPGHILTSFNVFDCAIGWIKGGKIAWHNHGHAKAKGFESPISVHEFYDSETGAPQSNEHFPKPSFPMFCRSRRYYIPIKISPEDWENLFNAIISKPFKYERSNSYGGSNLFESYRWSFESTSSDLSEILPESPKVLCESGIFDSFPELRGLLEISGIQIHYMDSLNGFVAESIQRRVLFVLACCDHNNELEKKHVIDQEISQGIITPPIFIFSPTSIAEKFRNYDNNLFATAGLVDLIEGIDQTLDFFVYNLPRKEVSEEEYDAWKTPNRKDRKSGFGNILGNIFGRSKS